jgi:hypothetical protein
VCRSDLALTIGSDFCSVFSLDLQGGSDREIVGIVGVDVATETVLDGRVLARPEEWLVPGVRV